MGIRNYRLYELDDEKFEELCSKICIKILGEGFVNFTKGRDGGKDGKFTGRANLLPSESKPYEGKFIVQAKHTTNGVSSCSDSSFDTVLSKEVPRIQKLKDNNELEHYFILTNRKLTGEREPKVRDYINTSVEGLASVTIWGLDRIHTHLDNNRDLHEEFGFNKPRTPLRVDPMDLEEVIKGFRDFVPKQDSEEKDKIKGDELLYTYIDKKNEINNLTAEYYEFIKEASEKYFKNIREYLIDPKHNEVKELYTDTALDFKGLIISRRGDFNTFDEVLEELYLESLPLLREKGIKKRLLKVFIHFMYFNCDIGQKTEDEVESAGS